MTKDDLVKKPIYIAHVREDGELASAIAEGLKTQGCEDVRRSVHKRSSIVSPRELSELDALAKQHLRKLRGPEPVEMDSRVFLSYAREDEHDVRRFHLELVRMGLDTFFDQSDIFGIYMGENWSARVFKELSLCCSMAFFLSPHSVQSTMAGFEIGFFIERKSCRSGVFLAIISMYETDTTHFERAGIPIVEYYKMTAKEAAERFIHEMVTFYRNEPGH